MDPPAPPMPPALGASQVEPLQPSSDGFKTSAMSDRFEANAMSNRLEASATSDGFVASTDPLVTEVIPQPFELEPAHAEHTLESETAGASSPHPFESSVTTTHGSLKDYSTICLNAAHLAASRRYESGEMAFAMKRVAIWLQYFLDEHRRAAIAILLDAIFVSTRHTHIRDHRT